MRLAATSALETRPAESQFPNPARGAVKRVHTRWTPAFPWIAGLCVLLSFSAEAESWTNRAGHVIRAQLVRIENDQVVLQYTNGRSLRLPLSSLKPADQQRAREQFEEERLPSELKACLDQAQNDIQRAAQFLQGGKITRDEYAARCKKIKERFEYLGGRRPPSDKALLARLKQRLDQAEGSSPRN